MKLLIIIFALAFTAISALAQPATPAWLNQIRLSAINGTDDQRLAVINDKTFSPGEANALKLKGRTVQVQCLDIREQSVVVRFQDLPAPYELTLGGEIIAVGGGNPAPAANPSPAVMVEPKPRPSPAAPFIFNQPAYRPPADHKSAVSLGLLIFVGGMFIALITGIALGTRLVRYQHYRHHQNAGEALLAETVANCFSRPHLLLNNITLPTPDGTTQIDHVLVADTGIFVIETKHYSGWIFGHPDDSQWTQTIHRLKSRFQNPIRQNFLHVKTLQSLFDLPENHFHSVVVFTGAAQFKTELGGNVLQLAGLIPFLTADRPVLYDERKLAYIIGRIEMKRARRSLETDEYHINHVRRKIADRISPPPSQTIAPLPSTNPFASASGDEKYQPRA